MCTRSCVLSALPLSWFKRLPGVWISKVFSKPSTLQAQYCPAPSPNARELEQRISRKSYFAVRKRGRARENPKSPFLVILPLPGTDTITAAWTLQSLSISASRPSHKIPRWSSTCASIALSRYWRIEHSSPALWLQTLYRLATVVFTSSFASISHILLTLPVILLFAKYKLNLYPLPPSAKQKTELSWRPMESRDSPAVTQLLRSYLAKYTAFQLPLFSPTLIPFSLLSIPIFYRPYSIILSLLKFAHSLSCSICRFHLSPIFSEEDVEHLFLPRKDVMYSYVLEVCLLSICLSDYSIERRFIIACLKQIVIYFAPPTATTCNTHL